ncbi:P-loop containing nucleoside triphosphate hydrolase protein [Amylocarpus encephaloides]|uniref:Structural maintenance of chromosomes protein 5 n=1 Tax=Amylocarpus encephaloides TaxID=45428 RepID=A0A9P8C4A0_9HELO|nr:P-loop containing nucleoside triphosphate hydrolase protein [Amylocarpus encephaloides]
MPQNSNRRSKQDLEDGSDGDLESQGSTPDSRSRKRMRTDSPPPTNTPPSSRQPQRDASEDDDDEGPVDLTTFKPGAIVRVRLADFVTYEKAEFLPGPSLNMIIGPNGTGKSSLVCAICLGLGFHYNQLGRATAFGDYVKHGRPEAEVEIELQSADPSEPNPIVLLRIERNRDNRFWWLNGKKCGLKNIQALVRGFNIQVDNLCQFLPQEKVAEFAGLSPVDLLLQTQRAAAPPEMIDQHEELKKLRGSEKLVYQANETDKEQLVILEARQESSRAEKERLEERDQVVEKVALLRDAIPFVEYRLARAEHREFKAQKDDAQRRLRKLQSEMQPSLQACENKKTYRDQVTTAVKARKTAVELAEKESQTLIKTIEALDEKIQIHNQAVDAQLDSHRKRRQAVQQKQQKIKDLELRQKKDAIEFNAAEWNERTRARDRQKRENDTEIDELAAKHIELKDRGRDLRNDEAQAKHDLEALSTEAGKQMNKLLRASPDTHKAWEWIQENRDQFEKEVYGPPLITCSVKDPRYTAMVESVLKKDDFLVLTAQTDNDVEKLNRKLFNMKLKVSFRKTNGSGLDQQPLLNDHNLQRLNLEGWALDFIEGPSPVLSMLCASARINQAAVSLRDITDDQFNEINTSGILGKIAAGGTIYQITRRREYGPQAVSTSTRPILPPSHWVDQPMDDSRRVEIQARIDSINDEFAKLKAEAGPTGDKIRDLRAANDRLTREIAEIREEKAKLQKAFNQHAALPDQIKRETEELQEMQRRGREFVGDLARINMRHDEDVCRRARTALVHKSCVSRIRICHQDLLKAEIRLIEANSDIEALEERDKDIRTHLENEKQQVEELTRQGRLFKRRAEETLARCMEIQQRSDNLEYLMNLDEAMTVDQLEAEIQAEEAKLDFIQANNPNAARDFGRRQMDVDKMMERIAKAEESLEKTAKRITRLREKWEPALDQLIAQISDAFSFNFEQIGCAGEVGIHKEDDFENWAIEIKVKFRENETLQILDSHRQSGGERSVSTIFYLMSLQSLARAPFRVVDEINQGMDPRNERMVHERMVEIACKEHTSQYFLITPKLLTGLKYDQRMKVLCIASGEHMPSSYEQMDVSKIIKARRAIMAAV